MKISYIIFTLCAASTSLSQTMQITLKKTPYSFNQIKKNTLQKRLCTNLTNSNSFNPISFSNKLLTANTITSLAYAYVAAMTANPCFLFPIIINTAMRRRLKLTNNFANNQPKEPELVTDIIFYVKATNMDEYSNILTNQDRINSHLKIHKEVNVQALSSLNLKAALNDYNIKLAALEESKNTINNTIIEPILPIFNKHKNINLEECLAYSENLLDISKTKKYDNSFFSFTCALVTIFSSIPLSAGILDTIGEAAAGIITPTHILSVLATGAYLSDSTIVMDKVKHLPATIKLLKTYKEYLKTARNIKEINRS